MDFFNQLGMKIAENSLNLQRRVFISVESHQNFLKGDKLSIALALAQLGIPVIAIQFRPLNQFSELLKLEKKTRCLNAYVMARFALELHHGRIQHIEGLIRFYFEDPSGQDAGANRHWLSQHVFVSDRNGQFLVAKVEQQARVEN